MLAIPGTTHRDRQRPKSAASSPQDPRRGILSRLFEAVDGRATRRVLLNRASANGLIREELDAVLRQTGKPSRLPAVLYSIAEDLRERGQYWDDLGLKPRARDHYMEASLWSFYAQLLLPEDDRRRAQVYALCAEAYRGAAPYFMHAGEAIEIPYRAGSLAGYLRLPQPGPGSEPGRLPCVLIINGLNSTKEELHYTENAFLNMGTATLSFDYPGLGESAGLPLESLHEEKLGTSVFLFLASRPEIDPDRLALHGISTGGSLALRLAAACPERYRAVAVLSAFHNLRAGRGGILAGWRGRIHEFVRGSDETLRRLEHRISAADCLDEISCPVLVAGGGRDPVIPAVDTRLLYDGIGSSDKKLLLCTRGSHSCYEMMPSLRYEIAQWIKQRA